MRDFFNIRKDFQEYSEEYRLKEVDILKDYLKNKNFKKGLELGAGTGFQSTQIHNMFEELIVSDFNEDRLNSLKDFSNIRRVILDSEMLLDHFDQKTFDFIYSSNHLEHLPNPGDCIEACYQVLKDDGICIHILPNPTWRLFQTILHYPTKILNLIDRFTKKKKINNEHRLESYGNNIKSNKNSSFIHGVLFPKPHGVSTNFLIEHFAFRKRKWI
ncbi:class I SAM-dependent methyltransferase, partial [Gammaproteobacteria bacterium]|nr:class I SAM-dependent methyltransferase [Gammaproteobacteria bacterium]